MGFETFEELEVWKLGKRLRIKLSKVAKSLPNEEKYRLVDQIIRASRSVTANIAEGFGRFHYQENIQFCRVSRGSLMELIDHLDVAKDELYISDLQYNELRAGILHCIKVLNGYIAYLQKAKQS